MRVFFLSVCSECVCVCYLSEGCVWLHDTILSVCYCKSCVAGVSFTGDVKCVHSQKKKVQKLSGCTFSKGQLLSSLGANMYILSVNMYILGANMYILSVNMYILGANMYI